MLLITLYQYQENQTKANFFWSQTFSISPKSVLLSKKVHIIKACYRSGKKLEKENGYYYDNSSPKPEGIESVYSSKVVIEAIVSIVLKYNNLISGPRIWKRTFCNIYIFREIPRSISCSIWRCYIYGISLLKIDLNN